VDVRQSAGGPVAVRVGRGAVPEAGGGVLLDFGVHLLDLLLWWLGDLRWSPLGTTPEAASRPSARWCWPSPAARPVLLELSRSRDLRDTVVVECERATVEIGVFEPAVVRMTLHGDDLSLVGSVPDAAFAASAMPTVFGRQLAAFVQAVRGRPRPW
jgi:predicted dehydrogenase